MPDRGPRWLGSVGRWLIGMVVVAVAVVGLFSMDARPVEAQQVETAVDVANEYDIKAVFLYNFGRYIQWPEKSFADASDPFVIGIIGDDSFGGALDEIAAKRTIGARHIVVRRFASPKDYRQPCQILFVSRSLTSDQFSAIRSKTEGQAVLLVGETPGFAERGGSVDFYVDEGIIRFEINLENARRAQLRMDAKLLRLGKPVGTPRVGSSRLGLPAPSIFRTPT